MKLAVLQGYGLIYSSVTKHSDNALFALRNDMTALFRLASLGQLTMHKLFSYNARCNHTLKWIYL